MFLAANFDRDIESAKAAMPEMTIAIKMMIKSADVILVRISWTAAALPVLVF